MSKIGVPLIVILICLSFRACEQRPQECRDVIDVSREQGYTKFRAYPIDTQLDVYLCAMHVEPPDLGLAELIADRGEAAIPVLLQKLQGGEREIDQEHIIYVFEVMSERGLLRGRKDIIDNIRQVIENMKITAVKQRSLERLKKIQIANGS